MITIHNVSKKFGNKEVLSNISAEINEGELIALLGANGAGKTTLMDLILKFTKPTDGKIINQINSTDVGVIYQKSQFINKMKAIEIIELSQSLYVNPLTTEEVSEILNWDMTKLNTYAENLSGGEQRLLDFVIALIGRPKFLIMDEPTTGMDIKTQQFFWSIVRKLKNRGLSILYTSHNPDEIEDICTSVWFLKNGKLIYNESIDTIRKQEQHRIFYIPLEFKDVIESCSYKIDYSYESIVKVVTNQPSKLIDYLRENKVSFENIYIEKQKVMHRLFDEGDGK